MFVLNYMKNLTFIAVSISLIVFGLFLVYGIQLINPPGEIYEQEDLNKIYELQREAQLRYDKFEQQRKLNQAILFYELKYYQSGDITYHHYANLIKGGLVDG